MAKISNIFAREILNSKGYPTVEVTVALDNGAIGISSCPTGTSVGKYEAKELRDQDPARFLGFGVIRALDNVINVIRPKLIGQEAENQNTIDKILIELDGTADKSKLGVNSILPVSMSVAKASSITMGTPLFTYIRRLIGLDNNTYKIPTPAFNILNGGKHAGNNLEFQEFLIIPATSMNFPQSLNMASMVYQSLKKTLKEKGVSTLVGEEGGFGPSLSTNRDALIMVNEAIGGSHYRLNYDIFLGIDASANNFFDNNRYQIKDKSGGMTSSELITVYEALNEEFSLLYLEDPLSEDDLDGWGSLNEITSRNTLIIGDDLTATNPARLEMAINKKAIGGIIIKPNQIGTVTETLEVIELARNAGLKLIASHRSGETNDDFIADFAVGVNADYVKFGAPARGERVAKYNRLLEIEKQIKQQ